ncbi:hypothetical protein ISF_00891 [Cordyceps fumosorosea ARSEF 2679]|uniref:Chloramphenicol acetyltransferase-like domain protein n=1 Tax=Cordyceps fumosorosea (strain ARSEF 2679) TaxID=1081104 RepID=A0A168EMI4_CORFA|nr:hypothetical protein ISF_00891 [Cordyceps fumosorosea ARSEF 2679]OAA73990.1 hypothetical protein ISF_00891 [Cordyceps fumosorosea ARSEF 2679]
MSIVGETEDASHVWRQTSPGTWSRACLGEEQTASYTQNVRDGHTELTIAVPFSCRGVPSAAALTLRARNAWLACHARFPQAAAEMSTGTRLPQRLTYAALRSDEEAAAWLRETLVVVDDGRSAEEVARYTYGRRLPTRGKRSMLYLVVGAEARGEHALVWNVSHVVSDAFSIPVFMNEMLGQMTKVPGDVLLSVRDIDYEGVAERLPIHPAVLYEDRYRPTAEQREQAVAEILAQEDLYSSRIGESIKMYPRADSASRPHETHCLTLQFTLSRSRALLAALRREGVSITYAAAAATLLAVRAAYARGDEAGALLGMTRNARRWVDTDRACASASSAVFLWIPFAPEEHRGSARDAVLALGRTIRERLQPYIAGPHHLSLPSLELASHRAIDGLGAEAPERAEPCPPGFSPQGKLTLRRAFGGEGGVSIEAKDFRHTGRQINESPWVGLFSLWDRLTLSLGFDSKYHDPEMMARLIADVQQKLDSVVHTSANL